ncbi:M1 family metallopeptidase [Thalassotalea sp. M1531]|uniref:Aminopeptidase n=1 Tax=Thalassotalea algicola TaxID=2716224 RepID=A0A7Y0Q657_9GAMM|nr:M1 family metallopeptidase [Thalassotalea algicola]NMP31038.1 M1 family metallopeptidase [Thalassotalea algicola]
MRKGRGPRLIQQAKLLWLLAAIIIFIKPLNAKQLEYRLPNNIAATKQVIELSLLPDKASFSGKTVIDLAINGSVSKIAVHGINLDIKTINLSQGESVRRLQVSPGEYDMLWLSDGKDIPAGSYQLTIDYNAEFSTDALGLYKTQYNDQTYLFTQFQSLYARRVFPSFDEPDTKIPYQFILTVPKSLTVVANTPQQSSTTSGDLQTVTFAETPPMPSYLLALTVGPLDKTPINGLGVKGNIYSPKGTANQTGYAVKHTPKILKALEQYFGMPYPYKKLDFIAVPDYAFGAMENPGLVTYRQELLLRGDNATASEANGTLNVIAHELAHMWYGDLVTMKWWDDLWLNEAFATWMAQKVMDGLYPELRSELLLPQEGAFYEDALSATKAIRKEVKNNDDIEDGLGLNYSKGHAILSMFEQLVGIDNFQLAIQRYMKKYQWKNTVADDLWTEVSQASGENVNAIASTYLDQPGYALVNFEKDGKITQQRFSNYGVDLANQQWQVPLAMKYKVNGEIKYQSLILDNPSMVFEPAIEAEWLFPVENGNGYFRWKLPQEQYQALLADLDQLSPREQVALLSNMTGLLDAGEISIYEMMELYQRMSSSTDLAVFKQVLEGIKAYAELYQSAENKAQVARLVTDIIGPWYKKLGAKTRKNDSDEILSLRPRVIRTLGQLGNEPALVKDMQVLAQQYLKSPTSFDAGLGREALRIAAMHGNNALAKQYFDVYLSTTDATLKSNIMGSIYFTDKASMQVVFDELLGDRIPAGDKMGPLSGLYYINNDQSSLYRWITTNYDALKGKLPEVYLSYMPLILNSNCDAANLDMKQKLFEGKGPVYQASLKKSVEATDNCIKQKRRAQPEFNRFVGQYQALN